MDKQLELKKLQLEMMKLKEEILKMELEMQPTPSESSKRKSVLIEAKPEGNKIQKVFAIMSGPRAGVYSTYPDIAEEKDIVKEFATKLEAELTIKSYLGPQVTNSFKEAIIAPRKIHLHSKMQNLGRVYDFTPIIRKDPRTQSEDEWVATYNKILATEPRENELIIPVFQNGLHKVETFPGANPKDVYDLFNKGLIDTIYLSPDREEISHFPTSIQKGIEVYSKKCKLETRGIFMKFGLASQISKEPKYNYHIS